MLSIRSSATRYRENTAISHMKYYEIVISEFRTDLIAMLNTVDTANVLVVLCSELMQRYHDLFIPMLGTSH